MNMNKTILATLISTAFSSSVIAQSVNIELANLETEKVIQSQMDSIDSATLAKLNAQNSKVVALDGVVYEQDESGVWKAIGTGALGLTAALFSGSSSSSSNKLSDTPNYEQGAIKPSVDNKPGLPGVDNDIPRDINLITHGDTAYMYINGEEVRSATLDVTSEGNYTITGSEGAMFHVTSNDVGKDVLVTMVNGESVKLHNVNRTDDRNISFSVEGENYNLHRTYSGEVWVQKEQGNGTGNWATIKTGADVLANIQERQLINAIDKTLPDLDNKPIQPDNDLKAQWSIGEDEKGRKALMNNGDVVAYVANDGTRLRNADNEPLGVITSSVNGNGATTYSVTLNNNSQFEGATITFREGNVGNKNITFTSADGQTTYHWRHDRGFYKVDIDNNWGVIPDTDNSPILPEIDGGEGSQELKIVDGGIFLGGEKIGFIASDGNVNLYKHGKIGEVTATSGGGNVSEITLNNGATVDIARNQGNAMGITVSYNNTELYIDKITGEISIERDSNWGQELPDLDNSPEWGVDAPQWADYDNDSIKNREFTQDKKALEALAKQAGFAMMGDYLDWQSGFSDFSVEEKNEMAFTMLSGGELTGKQIILMNNLTLNGNVSMLQTLMNDAYNHIGSWDDVTSAINAAYGKDFTTDGLQKFADRNQDSLGAERNAQAIRLLMSIEANGAEWVKHQIKTEIKDRIVTDPDFGQGERLKNIDRSKLKNLDQSQLSNIRARIQTRLVK
ncbi:exported hypothetical protein [Vibrio chagasii]|nr:exported hypothetical protein [Vibrio chagasii]CAH6809945.1 exported hypothetical protein [Vibrio chagasii]